ncbi:glycosyltransferase family 4 protein [Serinicoccus chungangensis]|uniref:glycosyltransferase family 4 protein n=1 Tax=Serinicoccus chungangensis TaxID=767452 RepID=UPI00128F2561|nr:glycosyltransferase family 4 protein [Serinicoccus chungangensis]
MAYATTLVNENNGRAAYEAVKNALDLNPGNAEAVQLLGKIEDAIHPPVAEFSSRTAALLRSVRGSRLGIAQSRRVWGLISTADLTSLVPHTADRHLRAQLEMVIALRKGDDPPAPPSTDPDARAAWLQAAVLARRYDLLPHRLSSEPLTDEVLDSIRAEVQRPVEAETAEDLVSLAQAYLTARPQDKWVQTKRDELQRMVRDRDVKRERASLIRGGYPLRGGDSSRPSGTDRVVYVLHESQPHVKNGYTVRSEYLRNALRTSGWDVSAVTRPGFGWANDDSGPSSDQAIAYHRLAPFEDRGFVRYVEAYAGLLARHARENRAAVIHAASNFAEGLASIQAARQLGLPCVYEMRGLWHLSRSARDPEWEYSDEYHFCEEMEVQAAGGATRVIVLSTRMKRWLILRGVSPERIDVVKNAVDARHFRSREKDHNLMASLGLEAGPIFGYVGSIVEYEGLEDFVQAMGLLRRRGRDASAVIIGAKGKSSERLWRLTGRLGLQKRVRFVGSVPIEDVPAYYSLCDAVVMPRRMTRVTDVVPPLKVLEPIAMGIPLITTSLPPIVETIGCLTKQVRFCRPGEPAELAGAMSEFVDGRMEVGPRSLPKEPLTTRSWQAAASQIAEVYRRSIRDTQ